MVTSTWPQGHGTPVPSMATPIPPTEVAMYTHVLVGTDGSETAMRAVDAAARLVDADDARLTVVHAFDSRTTVVPQDADGFRDEFGWKSPPAAPPSRSRTRQRSTPAPGCGALEVDAVAEPGHPVPVLLEAVQRLRPDVIVVGNVDLRRPRLRRGIGPSLSRKADVDVIIVDKPASAPGSGLLAPRGSTDPILETYRRRRGSTWARCRCRLRHHVRGCRATSSASRAGEGRPRGCRPRPGPWPAR